MSGFTHAGVEHREECRCLDCLVAATDAEVTR